MTIGIYSHLPSQESNFNIDVVGSQTGVRYLGDFVYRRPTIQTKTEIAKTAARLGGDQTKNLDDDTKALHQLIAWLEHCLVSFPDWWKDSNSGRELYDDNVLTSLSNKVMEFEEKWRAQIETPNPK